MKFPPLTRIVPFAVVAALALLIAFAAGAGPAPETPPETPAELGGWPIITFIAPPSPITTPCCEPGEPIRPADPPLPAQEPPRAPTRPDPRG